MTTIMESTGKGLTIYEAPTSIEQLDLSNVSDEFKEQFLIHWKDAYEAEKDSGNAGINILCVLEKMQELIANGDINFTTSFEQAYTVSVKALLESLE